MYIRNTYLTLKVSTNSTSTLSPLTLIEIKALPENKEMTKLTFKESGPANGSLQYHKSCCCLLQ